MAEPVLVRDVLRQLEVPLQHVRLMYVGRERVLLDTALKDGDTLHLFPVMAGG
jgi:molybdopterin converting factor small subunit